MKYSSQPTVPLQCCAGAWCQTGDMPTHTISLTLGVKVFFSCCCPTFSALLHFSVSLVALSSPLAFYPPFPFFMPSCLLHPKIKESWISLYFLPVNLSQRWVPAWRTVVAELSVKVLLLVLVGSPTTRLQSELASIWYKYIKYTFYAVLFHFFTI